MARGIRHTSAVQRTSGIADQAAPREAPDGVPEKIAKYVPAEVLAFFVPAASQFGDSSVRLWVLFVAALAGTVGYLLLRRTNETRPFFYPLAGLAFIVWALGMSEETASLVGLSARDGQFVMAVGIFVIPLADTVIDRVLQRRPPT